MKKYLLLIFAFVLFCGHDMYLKFDTYFLQPDSEAIIKLYNGTFDRSDNVIDRDRMVDVSLVGNGQHLHPEATQWSDRKNTTLLQFTTGEAGTWVAGVSTRPRSLAMEAEAFNRYLKNDGVLDMLTWREENNAMDQDAVEQYSKHVKTIFQVGDRFTKDWQTKLGYPIEFVPMSNPYHLHDDEALEVQLLWQGEPLADQLVYADHAHSSHGHDHHDHSHKHDDGHKHDDHDHKHDDGHKHDDHDHKHDDGHKHDDHDHKHGDGHKHDDHDHKHDDGHKHDDHEDHQHNTGQQLRTDANGIITLKDLTDGIWYLRTIHLTTTDAPDLTHESNWATLTFEVADRHSHDHSHSHDGDAHSHTHADGPGSGIPSYAYWLGSLGLLVGLFFWFNQRNA